MTLLWKQQIIELDSLSAGNALAAHRTALLVRQLLKNDEFLEDSSTHEEAESRLAKYSGRFCLSVGDMMAMIEHFPDYADWDGGRLDLLRDATAKAILAQQGINTRRNSRHVEFEARDHGSKSIGRQKIEQELRDLRQHNRQLQRENNQLRATLKRFLDNATKAQRLVSQH